MVFGCLKHLPYPKVARLNTNHALDLKEKKSLTTKLANKDIYMLMYADEVHSSRLLGAFLQAHTAAM